MTKKKTKEKTKTKTPKRANETPKDITKRIEKIGNEMVKDIKRVHDPSFETRVRGKANVIFDEKKRLLTLGDKKVLRNFLNVGHARKFMQTTLVLNKTNNYLKQNKTASIREIYYELKHNCRHKRKHI
jgi:DNA topoisomerase VI subunit A